MSMVCMEEWALVIQGESTLEEDQRPHHDPPEHHEMHATVRAQRKDPKLLAMVEYLQTKQWPKDTEVKEYIRVNNKAYRLGEHGQLLHLQQNTWGRRDGGQRWCLVVPEGVRHRVLKRAHEDVTGGHYAVYKTYHKIADRYYWTGLLEDVTQHVQSCHACQTRKPPTKAPQGLMKIMKSPQRPFQYV